MEKKKQKKKEKKLEKQNKLNKSEDNSSGNESNSSEDIPSDIDMNDPYFAEEFNKPEFKNSKKKNPKTKKIDEEINEEDEKRKAELELLLDDENDGKAHFSLKKIQEAESNTKKSKRKKKLKEKMQEQKKDDDFKVNVDDERFSALYNSHLFNIDPTDPNYKKTKNMERIIQEKLKRRPAEEMNVECAPKKSKEDAELSLLVKNIKRKTHNVLKK